MFTAMQRRSIFHSHWISHSPSLLDRTIFFGTRTGSFWGSKVRVSLTPILITFLSRQPRFCLSRWSGGHRFPVSLVTQAHLTALLFLNGRTPSGRIFLRVRQGPQQLNLLVDLGVTCCAQCAGVWPVFGVIGAVGQGSQDCRESPACCPYEWCHVCGRGYPRQLPEGVGDPDGYPRWVSPPGAFAGGRWALGSSTPTGGAA